MSMSPTASNISCISTEVSHGTGVEPPSVLADLVSLFTDEEPEVVAKRFVAKYKLPQYTMYDLRCTECPWQWLTVGVVLVVALRSSSM